MMGGFSPAVGTGEGFALMQSNCPVMPYVAILRCRLPTMQTDRWEFLLESEPAKRPSVCAPALLRKWLALPRDLPHHPCFSVTKT